MADGGWRKEKKALIIIGHGSKLKGFQRAMEEVARKIRNEKKYFIVLCAYLEITPPSIPGAIGRAVERGAKEIFVLPYFLLMGHHVKTDIPQIVSEARRKYSARVRIRLCPYLGYDDRLAEIVKRRIQEAR